MLTTTTERLGLTTKIYTVKREQTSAQIKIVEKSTSCNDEILTYLLWDRQGYHQL